MLNFTLSEMLQRLVNDAGMQALLAIVVLRAVLGMASAWKSKEFAVKRMGEFLVYTALPYAAVYALGVAVGDTVADGLLAQAGLAAFGALQLMNTAAILESLAEMGARMPEKVLNSAAGGVRANEIRERAQ